MNWFVRVQFWGTRRHVVAGATRATARVPKWLDFGPMSYSRAAAEGRRHVCEGRNARLVDPDGKEGPLITLPPATSPASPDKSGAQLELGLFSKE